mmetsp:Transcript_51977/g.121726  ORF Transcript_51977/g.121726 Transcript_51977/m.121726 type:complete len:297 (+) Transcript_51977:88-978(+)
MGRKRTEASAMGVRPCCPNMHTLERIVAHADFECDSCSADLPSGHMFFGCEPCDYSLCGGCYVKLATGQLEVPHATSTTAATAVTPGQPEERVDPDVADLCDHFEIEDRIMWKLHEAMKMRQDTYGSDMEKLWEKLKGARSPAGMLMSNIRQMHEGTFVGKAVAPPEVLKMIEKYRLDEDARTKLADFVCKRPESQSQDLYEIERRLENSGKPSAVVMTMIVALQKGGPLPELYRSAPHRDYAEIDKKGGGRGERGDANSTGGAKPEPRGEKDTGKGRDRERERRRSRSRDRDARR